MLNKIPCDLLIYLCPLLDRHDIFTIIRVCLNFYHDIYQSDYVQSLLYAYIAVSNDVLKKDNRRFTHMFVGDTFSNLIRTTISHKYIKVRKVRLGCPFTLQPEYFEDVFTTDQHEQKKYNTPPITITPYKCVSLRTWNSNSRSFYTIIPKYNKVDTSNIYEVESIAYGIKKISISVCRPVMFSPYYYF
jgi:hypothetical protein